MVITGDPPAAGLIWLPGGANSLIRFWLKRCYNPGIISLSKGCRFSNRESAPLITDMDMVRNTVGNRD